MQSGMMGNTVLRIYNPVSQAMDLDTDGHFVKQWVPELRQVSQTWIYEPWKMTPNLRSLAGWTETDFYPQPLVDFKWVHKQAKAAVTQIRTGDKPKAPKIKEQDGAVKLKQVKAVKKKVDSDPSQMALF